MKKIPSLFKRDYESTRQVYDEVVPGCEWVLYGEGAATEKFDGIACAVINGVLYRRYDRKKGRKEPAGWIPCEDAPDEKTGHWPGWVPIGDGPEDKHHRKAWIHETEVLCNDPPAGTYELVGSKVQGNPHDLLGLCLYRHGGVQLPDAPRTFTAIEDYLSVRPYLEGIVWHHSDGRMAKIKRRDFGLAWPRQKKPVKQGGLR